MYIQYAVYISLHKYDKNNTILGTLQGKGGSDQMGLKVLSGFEFSAFYHTGGSKENKTVQL